MQLQNGMKIQDLHVNPLGSECVKNFFAILQRINRVSKTFLTISADVAENLGVVYT